MNTSKIRIINDIKIAFTAILIVCGFSSVVYADDAGAVLDAAIAGEHRSPDSKARDQYRHPKETLQFFGFQPDMTVVEIWPGTGWYTEILAPALKEKGKLYAAQYSVNPVASYQRRYFGEFLLKLGSNRDVYGDVEVGHFYFPYELKLGPAESADLVVTFRNAHNWVTAQYDDVPFAPLAFKAIYDVLKPGGVLGLVDHRWGDASNEDPNAENGYISEERIIKLVTGAGFEFAGRSEINANPKDNRNHPEGVWTLPPTLAVGEESPDKYIAIGESDRMTLKFVKPAL